MGPEIAHALYSGARNRDEEPARFIVEGFNVDMILGWLLWFGRHRSQ